MNQSVARAVLSAHFGLDADVKSIDPLPGYVGRNFRVATTDGRQFVLKVASPEAISRDRLAFEGALLAHLSEAKCSGVPRCAPALEGSTIVAHEGSFWRLLTWVEGRPWSQADRPTPTRLESLGRRLAELDRELSGFDHEEAHRPFAWDLARASWVAPHIRRIPSSKRALLEDALLQYRGRALPLLATLPRGVIHGDANDDNVLVDGEEVVGFIDFGDAAHTVRVTDLAIACAYAMLDADDPIDVASAVARGWHDVLPLEPNEVTVLFDLVRARMVVSLVQSTLARERDPDNAYTAITQERAWRLLDRLREESAPEVAARLAAACGMPRARRCVPSRATLLDERRRLLGSNLSLSYDDPLAILRGTRSVLVRRERTGVPRWREQRRSRGARAPASRRGPRGPGGASEHEHAIPSPDDPRVRAATHRPSSGSALGVFLRVFGERSQ